MYVAVLGALSHSYPSCDPPYSWSLTLLSHSHSSRAPVTLIHTPLTLLSHSSRTRDPFLVFLPLVLMPLSHSCHTHTHLTLRFSHSSRVRAPLSLVSHSHSSHAPLVFVLLTHSSRVRAPLVFVLLSLALSCHTHTSLALLPHSHSSSCCSRARVTLTLLSRSCYTHIPLALMTHSHSSRTRVTLLSHSCHTPLALLPHSHSSRTRDRAPLVLTPVVCVRTPLVFVISRAPVACRTHTRLILLLCSSLPSSFALDLYVCVMERSEEYVRVHVYVCGVWCV